MTKKETIEFINANLTCNLATSIDNQPHTRGMMAYRADESGIIFHTGKSKDLYKEILKNPLVEICFFDPKTNIQLRVTGKAVICDDLALKKEIIQTRPFMKPWIEKFGPELLIVFKITNCVAHTWTFETNFSEKEYIQL